MSTYFRQFLIDLWNECKKSNPNCEKNYNKWVKENIKYILYWNEMISRGEKITPYHEWRKYMDPIITLRTSVLPEITKCKICWKKAEDPVKILPCNHGPFCRLCIAKWISMKKEQTCPICRKGIDYVEFGKRRKTKRRKTKRRKTKRRKPKKRRSS